MKSKKIAIVLPTGFATRDFLETPVLSSLANKKSIEFIFLTPYEEDKRKIEEKGFANIHWMHITKPVVNQRLSYFSKLKNPLRWLIYRLFLFWLSGRYGFGALVYRFNHIQRFVGHQQKTKFTLSRKRREASAGNYVFRLLGWPFPESRRLLKLIYKLYYSTWDASLSVEAFFEIHKPELLVLSYIQFHKVRHYSISARRRNIKSIGIIGSWDRLTTKGPICPGIDLYVVGSRIMKNELIRFHHIHESDIRVIGWPKIDVYKKSEIIRSRNEFMKSIGLEKNRRLIVFGGNSPRLGQHEPVIAEYISLQLNKGKYGPLCTLLIRPHPKDNEWENRFKRCIKQDNVILQQPEYGRLDHLANLITHADVLVASQGSICLDAIAMGTCVVNIAFDGDLDVRHEYSIKRWYEMDHYAPVVANQATYLATDFEDIDKGIVEYLRNPQKNSTGRNRVLQEQLEPFDGKASSRLVDIVCGE